LGATAGEMRDRHFVVIDAETKKFLTGREAGRLVLVECNLENDILTLGVINESGNSISVNVDQVAQNGITERAIWRNETCDGFDCGNEVAQWLQSVLKIPNQVRLLDYGNGMVDNGRILKTEDTWMNSVVPNRTEITVYANVAPYMAVSLASLTKLQAKLPPDEAEKVSMRNFRPNIVVDGCPEFDEDRWMQVKIGQAEFTVLKPCNRCLLTTVNTETGEKNAKVQPMKALREFRLAPEGKMRKNLKDSPIFGTFMGMDRPGAIRMGDVVYARYKKEPF